MNGSGMTLKEMSSDILLPSTVASTPCPRLSTSPFAPALETLADDDPLGSAYFLFHVLCTLSVYDLLYVKHHGIFICTFILRDHLNFVCLSFPGSFVIMHLYDHLIRGGPQASQKDGDLP